MSIVGGIQSIKGLLNNALPIARQFSFDKNSRNMLPYFGCNGISYGNFDLDAHLITPTDASPFDTSEDCASHHHPLLVR
jgi:hypothetical protein